MCVCVCVCSTAFALTFVTVWAVSYWIGLQSATVPFLLAGFLIYSSMLTSGWYKLLRSKGGRLVLTDTMFSSFPLLRMIRWVMCLVKDSG